VGHLERDIGKQFVRANSNTCITSYFVKICVCNKSVLAMDPTVSRKLWNTKARVQSQNFPCVIRVGERGNGTSFSLSFWFCAVINLPPIFHTHSVVSPTSQNPTNR
jgi:hypothetical protein